MIFDRARAIAWGAFMVLYLAGVPWAVATAKEVTAVFLVSLYANGATDYGAGNARIAAIEAMEAQLALEELNRRILASVEALEDDLIQ